MGNIFVVAACTAGKGRQCRFIRGQTSNHENHEYFAPRKLPAIRYIIPSPMQTCLVQDLVIYMFDLCRLDCHKYGGPEVHT